MRILDQRLFRFGLLFTPLLYLRWWGKRTFIHRLNPTTQLKMRVNSYDKQALREVWGVKEYQDEHFTIGPRDIVIDIGAHIGTFAVWAAQQATAGRVYAFEPNPENHCLLEENKQLNRLANLHIFNLAVSNKTGEAVLFNSDHHSLSHSFFEVGASNKTVVRTLSLADILQANALDHVNYLKIDAEGAEYLIVLNTPASVLRRIDKIIIEYHDYLEHDHTYKDLERYLAENGFHVELGASALQRSILKIGLLKARRITERIPAQNL